VSGDYKSIRVKEMAEMLKGTILEPHTVALIAMLYLEDGTMTAERRHDCHNGVCYAIGIQGHHICHRGTPLISGKPAKKYCTWKNGESPQQQFERDHSEFANDWHVQFQEYMLRQTSCIESGKTINQCIQAWNSREAGRLAKVERLKPTIEKMIVN
jgi:hypothetical protein